jgi:hypothetical protein
MAEKAGMYAKKPEQKQACQNSCKSPTRFDNSGSSADMILHLQRTAGNQAVQRLIKSGALQAKLKISQPNDMYEQETESLTAVDEGELQENAAETVVEEGNFKSPAIPQKAPARPEEDAAYQAVVDQLQIKAKHEKTPKKAPERKQTETKLAAHLTPEQIAKQDAFGIHLNNLEKVNPPEFTVETFMGEFKEKINKLAVNLPENKEKHGTVQAALELGTGKATAKQELANQNKALSDPLRAEAKKSASEYQDKTKQELKTYELKVDPAGATPTIKHAETAAPKPKTETEISLDDKSRTLDEALLNHNVQGQKININEESLAYPVSGENTFDEAGKAKREAQEEINKAKPRYREEENIEINKSQEDMQFLVNTGLRDYHHLRSDSFNNVLGAQKSHAGNVKGEKLSVFNKFQKIYDDTKDLVNKELEKLNDIEETFTAIVSKAEKDFESLVRNDLEYIYTPGFFDYSDWKDRHEGEIREEYERQKRLKTGRGDGRYFGPVMDPAYIDALKIVRDKSALKLFSDARIIFIGEVNREVEKQIAKKVVEVLNEARKHIKKGEGDVKKAFDELGPKEKKEAENVLQAVQGQFQTLNESVEDRQREIINDMARTYNQSVGKLQGTFDAIKKDVLTSWFEKAWNKLKAVVNAIIDFASRIAQLLGRIAYLAGDIISSPRYFFKNLVTGIGQGFSTFVDRIDVFLATAFFDWLRGSSGLLIQMPKDWGPKGIFSLFTQLLNLSTETIWQRMEVVYDKTIANAFRRGEVLLAKGLEIFGIVKNEGLGGLWDHLKESLGNILEETLGMIKETVLYAAIKKAIFEIGKMLVPGGGFIAIAEKVIRLLQFIVEARNKILDLIESFVDSMEMAVKGNIPGIVKHITGALTKFITIALDFLVTFFGLGSLKEKVERFIERMRKPIIRGIDWVLGKARPFVMKGKELLEKGKAALGLGGKPEETLKDGKVEVPAVTFTAAGKHHRLWTELKAGKPVVVVKSDEKLFDVFIVDLEKRVASIADEQKASALQGQISLAKQIADETEIDFAKVASLIKTDKPGDAGPKVDEVLSDEQKMASLLKGILDALPTQEELPSEKGALAAYRGIHFKKTWSAEEYDRQLKHNLVDKLTPSTAAVVLAGGKMPDGSDVKTEDLETAAEMVQEEVKTTLNVRKVKSWWGNKTQEFDNLFHAMLQRYINEYDRFREEITGVTVGHYNNLSFHEIPFISTSKKAIHAAMYAKGEKFIEPGEKRTTGIVGRIFVYLFSMKELKKQGAVDVASLQREGKIKIDPRILHEGEVAFTGSIPGENLVAQHDAHALASPKGLAELAERTAKEKAQEKGGLLRWPF